MLALGLFPRAGYLGVWAELAAALEGLGLDVPSAGRYGACTAVWAGHR